MIIKSHCSTDTTGTARVLVYCTVQVNVEDTSVHTVYYQCYCYSMYTVLIQWSVDSGLCVLFGLPETNQLQSILILITHCVTIGHRWEGVFPFQRPIKYTVHIQCTCTCRYLYHSKYMYTCTSKNRQSNIKPNLTTCI